MFFLPRSNPEESRLPTLFVLKSSFILHHHWFHPFTCGATTSRQTPSLSPALRSPAVPAASCAGVVVTAARSSAGFSHKAWNSSSHLCGVTSWVAEKVVSSEAGSAAQPQKRCKLRCLMQWAYPGRLTGPEGRASHVPRAQRSFRHRELVDDRFLVISTSQTLKKKKIFSFFDIGLWGKYKSLHFLPASWTYSEREQMAFPSLQSQCYQV